MKKLMILSALLVSGTALAVSPALAGPGGDGHKRGGDMFFNKIDTDGDGNISEAEFMNIHKERFADMDANNDGQITKDEAEAKKEEWREKMKERREKRHERRHEKPADLQKEQSGSAGDKTESSPE